MPAVFPSADWLNLLEDKLNDDSHYNTIAKNWEGDLAFDIQPADTLTQPVLMYLDLWRGKCRNVEYAPNPAKHPKPTFILRSPYNNFAAILQGKLDPMTAMMTSKLKSGRQSGLYDAKRSNRFGFCALLPRNHD